MKRVSKYVNQTKVINGISFTTVSYLKGKVEVVAYGYVGSMWVGTQTWKTKENGANVTKRSGFHLESKRFKESFVANEKPSSLLPAKLEDISLVNFWGHFDQEYFDMIDNEFTEALTLKEIKAVYRKYAKRLHPDTSRASNNTFEILKVLYEVNREMRIVIVDNCREAGIDMEY